MPERYKNQEGDLCPACKIGHLHAQGFRRTQENPENKASFEDDIAYKCDNPSCGIVHYSVGRGAGVGGHGDVP
jgi:hypothetical protein